MRFGSIFAGLAVLAVAVTPMVAAASSTSCHINDWFDFRSAAHGSWLCKGILAASEGKSDEAVLDLRKVVALQPHSGDAYAAHSNLLWLYFREGKYKEALEQIKQMLVMKPRDADTNATLSLLSALGQYPDLEVVSNAPSLNLHADIDDGNLYIPLELNGKAVTYMLDTGMNISIMTDSEARRLGINVKDSTTELTDISGGKTRPVRVAEVEDVRIGNTHLRHLAFVVVPDSNEPFVDLPLGRRGALGIQMELAMKSFRLDKDGQFAVDVDSDPGGKHVPLAFAKPMPVIQVGFRGKELNFTFDTGATTTILNPTFAKQFPSFVQRGSQRKYASHGLAGIAQKESCVLPSLTFSMGKPVTLSPATILLKDGALPYPWAAGNFGLDLLLQARPFTVDFSAMQVTLP